MTNPTEQHPKKCDCDDCCKASMSPEEWAELEALCERVKTRAAAMTWARQQWREMLEEAVN